MDHPRMYILLEFGEKFWTLEELLKLTIQTSMNEEQKE